MTDRVKGWQAAIVGAGAVMAVLTAAPAALAQATTDTQQQARMVPPNVPAADVAGNAGAVGVYDGRTLDAFARATRIVGALRNEYSPRIAAANIAGRPDRAEALFDEMRARMHDAIDATGLTIETYEAIASRAEHDRALRAQIEAIMTGARPPADTGLGVKAPQSTPIAPVSRVPEEPDDELASARDEIESLHRRLDAERTRARVAQERAQEDAAALRVSLEGAIERLGVELKQRAPSDEFKSLRVAAIRKDLARATLLREIAGLARAFASAGEAMAALGTDLSESPPPDVVPLARLEARPVLLAGSLPALARDLTAVQSRDGLRARLEAEQTRSLTLRAKYAAERVALRREIDRIGRDLAAATAALRALSAEMPNSEPLAPDSATIAARAVDTVAVRDVSDPMHDQESYDVAMPTITGKPVQKMPALGSPELEISGLVPPVLEHPALPAASVSRAGTVQAGIRAYETKDYARAYEVWQALAAAGEASAQFHLGALYFEGRGVARDLAQARRWLRAALNQGQERARFLLGRVETQLAKTG